jgi:peptide deformylase
MATSASEAGPSTELSANIVRYGAPVLRKPVRKVGRVTPEVRELVERMIATMRSARGIGLAANQVGVSVRVAVVEAGVGQEASSCPTQLPGVLVLVDPELVEAEGSEPSDEGCLSLPRLYGVVERPARVVVRARDLSGKRFKIEAEGMLARALSHEIDHLNGKLFIDRADKATLYWLLGHNEEGEPLTRPTTLENAVRVFTAARTAGG